MGKMGAVQIEVRCDPCGQDEISGAGDGDEIQALRVGSNELLSCHGESLCGKVCGKTASWREKTEEDLELRNQMLESLGRAIDFSS